MKKLFALPLLLLGCTTPPPPEPEPQQPAVERSDEYSRLPDMGPVSDYMAQQGRRIEIDRGHYTGTWEVRGKGYEKRGAGYGETVIDGNLLLLGSGWIISGLTVTGNLSIKGNNNDLEGVEVLGRVRVNGVGNKTAP